MGEPLERSFYGRKEMKINGRKKHYRDKQIYVF